jgi:hypothetical protein
MGQITFSRRRFCFLFHPDTCVLRIQMHIVEFSSNIFSYTCRLVIYLRKKAGTADIRSPISHHDYNSFVCIVRYECYSSISILREIIHTYERLNFNITIYTFISSENHIVLYVQLQFFFMLLT